MKQEMEVGGGTQERSQHECGALCVCSACVLGALCMCAMHGCTCVCTGWYHGPGISNHHSLLPSPRRAGGGRGS